MRKLLLLFALLLATVVVNAKPQFTWTQGDYTVTGKENAAKKTQTVTVSGPGALAAFVAATKDLQGPERLQGLCDGPNSVNLVITGTMNSDDLAALGELTSFKTIDMSGVTLAEGASISNIRAGNVIETVVLPNGLSKADVNAAGAALTTCNTNFGSCLSMSGDMEEQEVTRYYYTIGGEESEYTGNVSQLQDNGNGTYNYFLQNLERDLTDVEGYPKCLYTNTVAYSNQFEVSPDLVVDGKVTLSEFAVPIQWNNTYQDPFTNQNVDVPAEAEIIEINGNRFVVVDFSPNTKEFAAETKYKYQYTDANGDIAYTQELTQPDEDMKIQINYNQNVVVTPRTTTELVATSMDVIAYVNTEGSLYQATALAGITASSNVENVTISGHINNGDISWGGTSGSSDDPQGTQHDSDAYESNGAVPALVNYQGAPKSIDMSDAIIDDYRHLRVLNAWAGSLESVVFPKTVTKIPNYCCYSMGGNGCQNLSNIVFPTNASELTIGDYAFHHVAITSLLVPSTVTRIGDFAFATCPNLYDVEMEALSGTCLFGNNVFEQCPALQHVTLSEGTLNIGDYMFNQCGLLESIRIPSTCTTIGSYAFQFCFSIHEITIPEGVELIKLNAFEGAGLTDIYLMASSVDKLPKIYAMSPTGEGPSSFTYQRTTGNNTVPTAHRGDLLDADYDEVMTWYQEEQSGAEGLGTGNCLTALHYPESLKPFFEAIDVTKFYDASELASIPMQTLQTGVPRYRTPEGDDGYIKLAGNYQLQVEAEVKNKKISNGQLSSEDAFNFGDTDYKYLPQSYAVDPYQDGSNPLMGPDANSMYYPNQADYLLRMAAGATGTQAGGVAGEEVASAWGWRQFPLASSVESIGEIPYEKLYDDTWYTMCFPWKMEDNQLFSSFNQKCEIVEFKGAEMVQQDDGNYNLVFHFDDVAATYYMDEDDIEYERAVDGTRTDAAGHRLYVYTSKKDGTVVSAPDPLPTKNSGTEAEKEQYGKYLSIKNIMVLPGHPYMIHPSIGAAPGHKAKVYINGVKKVTVGGANDKYATYEALAEAAKVNKKVAEISKTGEAVAEEWKTPSGVAGGSYTFIGNINDAVETVDETTGEVTSSDYGKKDMPLPCYFLGVKNGSNWPMYYRRTTGGEKKWSQYTAIIIPDDAAKANIEAFMSSGSSSSAGAKEIVFGNWEIVDEDQMATVIENAVAEGKDKNEPAKIQHMNVVYNIKGQVIRSNSSSVEGLPKGLYIVNGKKYMVK